MNPSKIIQAFEKNETFLVTTHINPDPDALCSQLVTASYLKSKGKRVYLINHDAVPERFHFLPSTKSIKKITKGKKINYDVLVVLDCGDLDRIGEVKNLIKPNKIIINIDHHVTNHMFGNLNLVVPNASSTSEVMYGLLRRAQVPLDKNMATLIYLGIMTDTGSFRYDNTSAHTHEIVSHLLKFNIHVSELYRKIYENVPLTDLKYFTRIADNFEALYKGKVVCVELLKSVYNKFSEDFDLRDKIFKHLRTIRGVEVLVILTEENKNRTRINLRSQRKVNVARLASLFGGGGHRKASGCVIEEGIIEARKKIVKAIGNVL